MENLLTFNPNEFSKLFQREMIQSKIFDENVNFPFISDNTKIDVYLLEATVEAIENAINELLKKIAGKINIKGLNSRDDYLVPNFISPNTYHTGIGFVYRNSNIEFALQYFAKVGLVNAFMPDIGSDGSINWKNQTVIGYDDYIDRTYWEKATYIGTITNSKLLKIKKMILNEFVPKNSFYRYLDYYNFKNEMSNISPDRNIDTAAITHIIKNKEPTFKKSTCDTFAYFVIDCMKRLESPIKFITSPRETIGFVAGLSDPILLDENKQNDKKEILAYYKDLAERIKIVKQEVMNSLLQAILKFCSSQKDETKNKEICDKLSIAIKSICLTTNNPDIKDICKTIPPTRPTNSMANRNQESSLQSLKDIVMLISNLETFEPFIPKLILSLNSKLGDDPKQKDLGYIIYYAQDDNGNANYYKITYLENQNPQFYTNYVISDLNRNIPFKDINKNVIQTEFVEENSNAKNEDIEKEDGDNTMWGTYILAFILLVIFVILCYVYKNKRK